MLIVLTCEVIMEKNRENDVRLRLIRAGLCELEEHGVSDFSLRRVAAAADVSCAAPYRHFKDKNELILAIIAHVRESWELLAKNIYEIYSDKKDRVVQLSVAALRFWLANGNFRSVLLTGQSELDDPRRKELSKFDAPLTSALSEYTEAANKDKAELEFLVLSLTYGAVSLIVGGNISTEAAVNNLRSALYSLL